MCIRDRVMAALLALQAVSEIFKALAVLVAETPDDR